MLTASSPSLSGTRSRDRFLDAVKAIAISRVIAWHTWSWWWLSWIGAMPAMFFASGALLDVSLSRHGYWPTLQNRLRRLLIPFWWYSACAVVVMLLVGWRPSPSQIAPWIVPLGDPVGSAETPGLWIPLWYVRAYLWFVIGAGILRFGVTVLGRAVLALPVLATLGVWLAERGGTDVPIAVGDAATYSFFVLLGMLYARGATVRGRAALLVGAGALVAAIAWWATFGPESAIVNASYPLMLLAGLGTVGILLAAAPYLRDLGGLPGRVVDVIGARALTIYLWQGFGLLTADQLVTRQEIFGVTGVVASIVVVVTVTAAAAWAFGWIEDLAARRRPRMPRLRLAPLGAIAGILLLGAAAVQPASGTTAALPASGQAVLDQNRFNEELAERLAEAEPLDVPVDSEATERVRAAFDQWTQEWGPSLQAIESAYVEATVITAEGDLVAVSWPEPGAFRFEPEETLAPWLSLSKTVTGAWLAQLDAEGVVSVDDPLSTYLPQVPHGDQITLEHLIRHRSGLPTEYEDASPLEANPRRDLEAWFADPQLDFEPGTGFGYSRRGYFLLAWALEEASGQSWSEVVHEYADAAGVEIVIDEEIDPWPEVSHPGDGDYRGRSWSAGGLAATTADSARFYRWLFTEGLAPEARALMTDFESDAADTDYGFALLPVCPCDEVEGGLHAPRFGLAAATATWVFDERTGAIVFLSPDRWLAQGPEGYFYLLQHQLLDAAAG